MVGTKPTDNEGSIVLRMARMEATVECNMARPLGMLAVVTVSRRVKGCQSPYSRPSVPPTIVGFPPFLARHTVSKKRRLPLLAVPGVMPAFKSRESEGGKQGQLP
jgi:hypothetical protein